MSFGENLKYLCSFQHSIASVCRDLAINRQQFNRYLNNENYPRGYNLRRICDYFNLRENQLNLSHREFLQTYNPNQDEPISSFQPVENSLQILNKKSGDQLDKYLGYYYEYYYSMCSPEHILKGLVCIKRIGESVYYERFERLVESMESGQTSYCRYKGIAMFLNERIFMLDYESINSNEIVEIILYPSFKQRVSILEGKVIGVSANTSREPISRNIVLEYIGSEVSLKSSLKSCYLYTPDSDLIPRSIKDILG